MKSVLFSLSCLVSLLTFCQTKGDVRYLDIEKAEASPDSIEYLFLDCNTDNCDKVFSEFNLYSNLKGVYISNYDKKTIGKNIKTLSKLESLTIEKSPQINLGRLFSDIDDNENLKSISLKDNDLTKLPANIKNLNNLKSINISNNNNLNLEKTIDQIAELENLEDIYLPVNSITDLPDNIASLSNLKTLDISNNYLEDLPDGIGELRSLEELYIEGNLIQDAASSLEKVQNINLKYIALDDGLSDKEKERLKELFPNAAIKEVDVDESLDEQIENNIDENENTTNDISTNEVIQSEPVEPVPLLTEKETNNITYGELKVSENKLKLYSQAYIHYPDVFKLRRFSVYDSTMFEERFIDTTYANVTKIQYANVNRGGNINTSIYEKFRLSENRNNVKGENWFIFRGHTASHLTSNNPELNAFIGMSWVHVGNLTTKEFKNKYLRRKGYKWYKPSYWGYFNKWKFWTDVRITYNSEEQNFTLKLKDLDGFTEITAYPRYNSLNRSIDDAQNTYVKRYARYSKSLDRRKRRFERRHQRDKSLFERSNKAAENKRWKSFQKNYMSEEERKLSKEEWLKYYDKVIANERKAMGNATGSINNITRSLDLDGYNKGYLWNAPGQRDVSNRTDTSFIQPIRTLYQDKDSNMIAVKRILIIDKDTKSYQTFEGSLGIKMLRLNLIEGANAVFVVQLRNDDIGYVKSNVYQNIKFPKSKKYKFTLSTINIKFGSVQMIREELNF